MRCKMSEQINPEVLLPYGEKLKPLLNKSCISDSNVRDLLLKRGIYLNKVEKKNYIPLLTMSILSPNEFEYLQESQKTKEDSIKYRTSKVKCEEEEELQNIIPLDLFKCEALQKDTDSFTFHTDLDFSIEDKNRLVLEYEIMRDDLTKDWAATQSKHLGRLIIEKDDEKKEITFKNEFTASEVQETNDNMLKILKEYLITNGTVNSDVSVQSITSESFSEEERFVFMLQLANDSKNNTLEFQEVKNIEIGPTENAVLPKEAEWMATTVKNMIINGKGLQEVEYIKEKKYHSCLILREIEAQYKFKIGVAKGTCIIEYGFPHYFRRNAKDKSFQASISRVYFDKDSKSNNLRNISRQILGEFEETKEEKYREIVERRSTT